MTFKGLADLAVLLTNCSRVLLDFEGVSVFDPTESAKLTEFSGKLQNEDCRVVLRNLEPIVQASFFPLRSMNVSP